MGELVFEILKLIGFFAGRWLLPRLSRGRLIVMPKDAVVDRSYLLAGFARMPDGRIGVDGHFVGTLLALFLVIAAIGLCCLFL